MSDTEAKRHDASQQKLRKKRQEGQIANSQTSVSFLVTAAGLVLLLASSGTLLMRFQDLARMRLDLIQDPSIENIRAAIGWASQSIATILAPIVICTLATSLLVALAINGGMTFSMKPVAPQLNRVSPSAGIKRVFGKRGWVELATLTGRVFIWLGLACIIGYAFAPALLQAAQCDNLCQSGYVRQPARLLIIAAIVILILFAALEILLQQSLFLNEQKMTDTERKREQKDNFGSQEIRQERNRLRNEINGPSGSGPRVSQADATIIFVSPHGAIAIAYDPPEQGLPLLAVKISGQEGARQLLGMFQGRRIPIARNGSIVSHGLTMKRAEQLSFDYFQDFARAYVAGKRGSLPVT